jgi:predicted transcriptional regulator YheO
MKTANQVRDEYIKKVLEKLKGKKTMKEIAEILGVSKMSLYNFINKGKRNE